MDTFDAVVLPDSLTLKRRRPVRKDPAEYNVEGLRATLAVNAKPRRWRPAGAL